MADKLNMTFTEVDRPSHKSDMPNVALNGIDLFFDEAGDGLPLLMVAGFSSDSQSWLPVTPLLSSSHRLIMPDNRSAGQTLPKNADTSIEQMAADCVALMDALELERIDLLGHSMGGMIAMYLAAEWPDRVDRLVVSATRPTKSARTASLLDTLVSLHEAEIDDTLWYTSLFHWLMGPEFFEDGEALTEAIRLARTYPYRPASSEMRRQANAIAEFDLGESAKNIRAPTLAILGGRDLLLPSIDSVPALQTIPGIRICEIPDAAHSVHWNQPEAFAAEVLNFLSRG